MVNPEQGRGQSEFSGKPDIRFVNLELLDAFIITRMAQYGTCVVCVDGKRGIGKTTLQTTIRDRREQLFPLSPPIRPLHLEMDLSLYPRHSKERSMEHSSYDFIRWKTFQGWVKTTIEALKKHERTYVTLQPVYLRKYEGSIKIGKGLGGGARKELWRYKPWTFRREIPYPNPLVVVSGSFSHDQKITGPFSSVTEPIRILIEADPKVQEAWIERRQRSKPYRAGFEERIITEHDNHSWDWYGHRYDIRNKAHIIVRAEDGHFTFQTNGHHGS